MVTPDPKQRDPVIYLSIPPEPSTCLTAAPPLEATQEWRLAIRCVPELPGNDTSTVPDRILVRSAVPQVDVPAESVNRLAANAAKTRAQTVGSLAVRSRRHAECCRQPSFAVFPPAVLARALCDVLGSYVPGGKVKLDEVSKILGLHWQI